MTIRFTLSPTDMGAFQRWWLENTPEGKKFVQNVVIRTCGLIAVLLALIACLVPTLRLIILLEAVVGIAVAALVIPARLRKNASAQTVKMYSSASNESLFGERTLEITEEGLLSISKSATSLYKWDSIQRIARNDTHAFLTVGSMMAMVIPRGTVSDGNLDAFVAEAQRLHQQARTRVPAPAVVAR